jgi:hypothetical protein
MSDDAPRDHALIADVLHHLQEQLHAEPVSPDDAYAAEVETLVSSAIAELQRISVARPLPGSGGPVLGIGVIHELVRNAKDPQLSPSIEPAEHALDTTR